MTNLGVPDASSTLARAVAATDSTVFFGGGSTLGGGGTASRASLFAYDRAAGGFTNVTPTEMLPDPSMRELSVVGDTLVAGSAGGTEPSKMAILDLADLSSYRITALSGKVTKMYAGDRRLAVLRHRDLARGVLPVDAGGVVGADRRTLAR